MKRAEDIRYDAGALHDLKQFFGREKGLVIASLN
jgi:hypothetical protein